MFNFELSKLADWTRANDLSLIVEKTFTLVFSNGADYDQLAAPSTLDGIPVQFDLHGKILQLLFDSKLTFYLGTYIGVICKKL